MDIDSVAVDEGDGPALALIHGVAADSRVWDRVRPLISGHFRVLTFDLPGLSLLDLKSQPMTPVQHSRVVVDALEQRGIEQFSIVGHSYGASAGLICAQTYPSRVRCITAIAPGGFGPEINPFLRLMTSRSGASMLRLLYAPAVRGRVERGVERYRRAAGANEAAIDTVMDMYQRLATDQARATFRQSLKVVMEARRVGLRGRPAAPIPPVQIVWGSDDLVLPSTQAETAARYLQAQTTRLIEGAGHAPHRTHADQIAELILSFHGSRTGPERA